MRYPMCKLSGSAPLPSSKECIIFLKAALISIHTASFSGVRQILEEIGEIESYTWSVK